MFHFLFSYVSPKILAFMRKWKNMVEPDRTKVTKWCMCFACTALQAVDVHCLSYFNFNLTADMKTCEIF